jgi:hypothetical protein
MADALKELATAIILQAVKDHRNPGYQADVDEFLDSPWFETLADATGINPENAREKLKQGEAHVKNFR